MSKSKDSKPPILALSLGDETYQVTILDPDKLVADAAVRLTKDSGDNYDITSASGFVACECKGFLRAGHCKHSEALVTVGLLKSRSV